MRAANLLPGRGSLMQMMSLHLHVNQKSDYGDCIFQKFLSGIQSESQTVWSQIKSHIEPDLGPKVIRSLQMTKVTI